MCIARPVDGYRGLVETCRERANELALSRQEIDRLSGLPDGYAGKLLGKANGSKAKRMWPKSLEEILRTLGLQIIVIEDHAATSKTLARRAPVDARQQRFNNKSNAPKQIAAAEIVLLAPPTPVSRAHLRVVQSKRPGRSKYG
jgi:hypothetical protein